MECSQFEKILMLYREGERSPAEQEALEKHLQHCDHCRSIAESVARMDGKMEEFRRSLVPAGKDDEAIGRILQLTAKVAEAAHNALPSRFLFVARTALFRYAASILITGLITLFLVQNYHAVNSLAQLEKQFGRHTVQTVTTYAQQEPSMDQIVNRVSKLSKDKKLTGYVGKLHIPMIGLKELKQWRALCSKNPQACEKLSQIYFHNLKEVYQ